jgi:mRNA interferase MazF
MPISNKPKPGEILICQFPTDHQDLVDGEMAKDRLVIVMNKPLPGRGKLVNVVPISMTVPDPIMPWHVQVPLDCLPAASRHRTGSRWAKCDMISTVGWGRLNRYEAPMRCGRRVFQEGRADMTTYVAVKRALATVLNITASVLQHESAVAHTDADGELEQSSGPEPSECTVPTAAGKGSGSDV